MKTKREHADETERKMNPNNPWSRQKENIYIIHLILTFLKLKSMKKNKLLLLLALRLT